MAVLNDYECSAHGLYEAYGPVCPHGCSERFQKIVFTQAPAYHNGKTARTDRNLRGLAEQAGLTDMKNDPKSGESVMSSIKRGNYTSQWGAVPAGKVGAADFGVQPDQALKPGQFGRGIPTQLRTDPRGTSDLS